MRVAHRTLELFTQVRRTGEQKTEFSAMKLCLFENTQAKHRKAQTDTGVPAGSQGEECCLSRGDAQLQGHPWQPAAFPLGRCCSGLPPL